VLDPGLVPPGLGQRQTLLREAVLQRNPFLVQLGVHRVLHEADRAVFRVELRQVDAQDRRQADLRDGLRATRIMSIRLAPPEVRLAR